MVCTLLTVSLSLLLAVDADVVMPASACALLRSEAENVPTFLLGRLPPVTEKVFFACSVLRILT